MSELFLQAAMTGARSPQPSSLSGGETDPHLTLRKKQIELQHLEITMTFRGFN